MKHKMAKIIVTAIVEAGVRSIQTEFKPKWVLSDASYYRERRHQEGALPKWNEDEKKIDFRAC
jgi:hypothetical protein